MWGGCKERERMSRLLEKNKEGRKEKLKGEDKEMRQDRKRRIMIKMKRKG